MMKVTKMQHYHGLKHHKGPFCSQILVEWKIIVELRPPESYNNFWVFQFGPARRMALNLG